MIKFWVIWWILATPDGFVGWYDPTEYQTKIDCEKVLPLNAIYECRTKWVVR